MTTAIINARVPTGDWAPLGAITLPYPSGITYTNIVPGGEMLSVPSIQFVGAAGVTYTASGVVVTNTTGYTIKTGELVRLQTGNIDPRVGGFGSNSTIEVNLRALSGRAGKPARQFVGTKGILPLSLTANDTYTYGISRTNQRGPSVPFGDLRTLHHAFWVNSSGETDLVNSYTLEAAIETVNPVAKTYPLFFAGKKNPTVDIGAGLFLSDSLGLTLDAKAFYAVRNAYTIGGAQQMSGGNLSAGSGGGVIAENFRRSSDPSITYSTGFFAGGTGIQGNGAASCPIIAGVTGIPAAAVPAVVIYGDSIAIGSGDTVTGLYGGEYYGLYDRGMMNIDGGGTCIMHVNYAIAGLQAQNFTPTSFYRLYSALEYANIGLVALGTNDIVGLPTLATLQGWMQTIWGAIRARGCKVAACTVLPRTSGTYTSAAGQTVVAGWETGGLRDQYNAWLVTQLAAGAIDYLIDANPVLEDQTTAGHGKWVSTGGTARTSDGIHPNNTGHVAGANYLKSQYLLFTAT